MTLSDRERAVLTTLVDLFIRDAVPVSSGHIQSRADLGVSSATIRTILHRLEDQGLLLQPHTSAGRVPTPEAYRLYVEELCPPVRVPEAYLRRIRSEVDHVRRTGGVEDLLVRFSKLLAGLSNNVGFGFALEDRREAAIERIELVMLHDRRLLVVVTLRDGDVRTCLTHLDHDVAAADLEMAAQILNEIAAGHTPGDARVRLDAALLDAADDARRIARRIAHEHRLFADANVQPVHLEGVSQIMGQPEFQDPENLRFLVHILDHPEQLQPLLRDPGSTGQPAIHIGGGSAFEVLRPFSLVSAACDIEGRVAYVGILGPMRMHYSLAVSLVSGVVAALSALGGNTAVD